MSELDAWHTRNDAYLSAALAWLRLRLERQARQLQAQPTAVSTLPASGAEVAGGNPAKDRKSRWSLFRRSIGADAGKDSEGVPRLPSPGQEGRRPPDECARNEVPRGRVRRGSASRQYEPGSPAVRRALDRSLGPTRSLSALPRTEAPPIRPSAGIP